MKRVVSLLIVQAALFAAGSLAAQEDPHALLTFDRRSFPQIAERRFVGLTGSYLDHQDEQITVSREGAFISSSAGDVVAATERIGSASRIPHFFHGLDANREHVHVYFFYTNVPVEDPPIVRHVRFSSSEARAQGVDAAVVTDRGAEAWGGEDLYETIGACSFAGQHVDGDETPMRADGALCGTCDDDFVCFRIEESVRQETVLSHADIEAQLEIDERWHELPNTQGVWPGDPPELSRTWRFGAPLWLPDGQLFITARLMFRTVNGSNIPEETPSYLFVLQRTTQGEVRVRLIDEHTYVPVAAMGSQETWDASYRTEIYDRERLLYDPAQGRVYLPVGRFDHSVYEYDQRCVNVEVAHRRLGWHGEGLRVFEVDGQGTGYIPLTELFIRDLRCEDYGDSLYYMGCRTERAQLVQLHDGVGYVRDDPDDDYPGYLTVRRLDLSEEHVDVDGDGVRDAVERRLGTNPFSQDEDGDRLSDRVELLRGSDPSDGDEAWASYARGSFLPIVHPELSPGLADVARYIGHQTACVPYCVRGADCVSPGGEVILDLSTLPENRGVIAVAQDGSHVVVLAEDGVWRRVFETGEEELLVDNATLESVIGRRELWTLWPVDLDTLWIWTNNNRQTGLFLWHKGELSAVDPIAQAICAGGGDACDPAPRIPHRWGFENCAGVGGSEPESHCELPVHGVLEGCPNILNKVRPMGFDAVSGRVLFDVPGNWDSWIAGLHPTDPAVAFHKGDRTQVDPSRSDWRGVSRQLRSGPLDVPIDVAIPTGHDDLFVFGRRNQSSELVAFAGATPRFAFRNLGSVDLDGAGDQVPMRVWDDTIVLTPSGVELTRFDPGMKPGEIALVGHRFSGESTAGYSASGERVGVRGGIGPLWGASAGDVLEEFYGMNVSEDGERMCVAGRMRLPDEDGAIIEESYVIVARAEGWLDAVIDLDMDLDIAAQGDDRLVDCMFDGDELVVLGVSEGTTTMLRMGSRPGAGVIPEVIEEETLEIRGALDPRLVRRGDAIEVFFPGDGDRNALFVASDGKTASIGAVAVSFQGESGAPVYVDDQLIAVVGGLVKGAPVNAADVVLRSDGILVASVEGRLHGVYTRTGATMDMGWDGVGSLGGMQRSRTPWLSLYQDIQSTDLWPYTCAEARAPEEPEDMTPMDDDPGDGGEHAAEREGCGCGTAPAQRGELLVIFALLALFRRRSRRRSSRNHQLR